MHRETQISITEWAESVFGKPRNSQAIFKRMAEEVKELFDAVFVDPSSDKIKSELADVAIMLYQLANTVDASLLEEIDKKMQINRNREWEIKDDGTGQHKDD